MSVDIKVELTCSVCGAGLEGHVDTHTHKHRVVVLPCQRCATVPMCELCGDPLTGKICDECLDAGAEGGNE